VSRLARFLITFFLFSTLVLLGSLRADAGKPDPYQARVFPQMSMPGADLTFTFEHVGDLTEKTYCMGIEVTWPDGTHSGNDPRESCPPFEEYQARERLAATCEEDVIVCPPGYDCFRKSCRAPRYELVRRWTFSTRGARVYFGPGEWDVHVRFLLYKNKDVHRIVHVIVGGAE